MSKLTRVVNNPWSIILYFAHRGYLDNISDEKYIRLMYKAKFGKSINLESPTTYNEKLQWIKLYDRKPIYSCMVDKYEVKKYVSSQIGEQYIIPTIGVWDSFDEIDFNRLPDKFVLKCTHDSGGLVICKDKQLLDINLAREKIEKSLKTNYYLNGREWPYKDVKPRIICEEYISDSNESYETTNNLTDYKIYTFNGKAKLCMINKDRGVDTRADYFDKDYNWYDIFWGYPHSEKKPQKPKHYEKMFELAEVLARDTFELRVDFYEANGKIYFGELTFFDGGGFEKIVPEEWDKTLGSWIKLPVDV